jgi:hypothetical protein
MIDHTGIGVADVSRSAVFHDAALDALGLRRVMQIPEGVGTDGIGCGVSYPVFWIDRFHPTRSNPGRSALSAIFCHASAGSRSCLSYPGPAQEFQQC